MKLLDVDELLQSARERTGLADFGPEDYLEGLNVLVKGINEEVNVADDRRDALRERFLRLLMNRLWFAKDLKDHPEILEEDVGSPIVITSLPRTASTKLHRMLGAAAKDFQTMKMWQTNMFARIPGLPDGGKARRIQESREYEEWIYRVSPSFIIGHPIFTDEPEEDKDLGEFTFRHTTIFGMFGTLQYAAWVMQADMAPMYDYLLQQLKYLQWQSPRGNRPWLLKTPCHFGNERHLCRIFENPRFIVTHRDPVKCIPSITTTSMASRVLYSNDDSSANLGAGVTQLFSSSANEHMKWRGETPNLSIIDIAYDELNREAMSAIQKIYDHFGMALSAESAVQMRNWEQANRRDKHPANVYSSAAIGMTDEEIRRPFKSYIEQFAAFVN